MKLSGYCELPLIDLLWDTGFIILWAAVLLDEFKTFIASKWCRFVHKRTARVKRLLRLLYTWYNSLSCFPCLSNRAQVRNNQYGTHELILKKCQNPYVFILTSFLCPPRIELGLSFDSKLKVWRNPTLLSRAQNNERERIWTSGGLSSAD